MGPVPREIQEGLDRITVVVVRVRQDSHELREAQCAHGEREAGVGDDFIAFDRFDPGVHVTVAIAPEGEFEVREHHVWHPRVLATPAGAHEHFIAVLRGAADVHVVPLLTEPLDRVVDVMIAIFDDENVHGLSPWCATTSPSREWMFYCTTNFIGLSSAHVQ